ncbi:MAG: SPOR domain-containing protein [Gammaproteobacteria bacterium]|nr:SPOR domain-containing protein [Gammaproteobacteria bacterium]
MSRDYAKTPKPKDKKSTPGWVWMLSGLVIGLFIAFLVYINNNTSNHNKTRIAESISKLFADGKKTAQQAQNKTREKAKEALKESKPKFDFYTILPELEIAIPEEELTESKPATSDKTAAARSPDNFILQAGSFRSLEQADHLKAKLALQGIVANIQNVKINNDDTWYRVRIGPLPDVTTLNQTRKRLRANNIASIVVKEKG